MYKLKWIWSRNTNLNGLLNKNKLILILKKHSGKWFFSSIKLFLIYSFKASYKTKKIFFKFSKVSIFQIFLKNKIRGKVINNGNNEQTIISKMNWERVKILSSADHWKLANFSHGFSSG